MPRTNSTYVRPSENLGARLQARREAMGLSVADLSTSTNIRADYITAIEQFDQAAMPAIGYTLGYVRSYSAALGMDPDCAVKDYKAETELTKLPLRNAPHLILRRHFRLPRGFVSALSVASAALMISLWYGTQSEAVATPTPAVKIAAQYTALEPAAPLMQEGLFTLRTTSPSWIQIRDVQGTVQESRIFVTGETWQGEIGAGYSVSVRDAGAVELYNGPELIGTLGEMGQPVSNLTLSRDLPSAERP